MSLCSYEYIQVLNFTILIVVIEGFIYYFILRFLTEVNLFVTFYVNLSLIKEYSIMQEYKRVFPPTKHY